MARTVGAKLDRHSGFYAPGDQNFGTCPFNMSMKEVYLKQATDSDLAKLAGQEISCIKTDGNNSAITDEGLKYIPKIVGLRELNLEWAIKITGIGIETLTKATSLTYIDLSFCSNVSENAISKLQATNSGVTIER